MQARYRWKITKDHLEADDENSAIGKEGPHNLNPDIQESATEFRMYDDDGTLYYQGMIFGDFTGFEPLDDFGMPNAGCTEIKQKSATGHWIIL